MRHLIPDVQTPTPKLTFYHPMLAVADAPPKSDDDEVEAGSDPDGRWGRGSRIQRNAECSLLGCNLKLGLAAI